MAIEALGIAIKIPVSDGMIEKLTQNAIEQAKHEWGKDTEVEFHDEFARVKLHSHFVDIPL